MLGELRASLFDGCLGQRIQQRPDVRSPFLRPGAGHGAVRLRHLIPPRDHERQLTGEREHAYLVQRQGPVVVGAGGVLEGVDACGEELGLRLVVGEDAGGGVDSRLHGVVPQQLAAERMDRPDDGFIKGGAAVGELWAGKDFAADALAHLRCRCVGERYGSDLRDTAFAEKPNVAVDEHARLSAPRAGVDEDVAASTGDDLLLLGG